MQNRFDEARALDLPKKISVPINSEPPDFESKFSGIFWSFTHAWFDEFNRAWVNKPTLMQNRFDEARALDLRKKISVPKNSEPPDFESKFSGIFWSFTHAWFDEFNRAWVNKPTLMQNRFDEARALDLPKKISVPINFEPPDFESKFSGIFLIVHSCLVWRIQPRLSQ